MNTGLAMAVVRLPREDEEAELPTPRRRPICALVTFGAGAVLYSGLAQNIGAGGLFIASRTLFPVGDRVRLVMLLPGSDIPFEAEAEVRWIRDAADLGGEELPPGMG